MMVTELGKKARWANEAIIPANDMLHKSVRSLVDLPSDVAPGARQVAQLTAWRSAQNYALEPIMLALKELQHLNDWRGGFLVADNVRFDWKTAPIKHYGSFEEFYRTELERTWGAWSDLQQTYAKYSRGEIGQDEAHKIVEENARRARWDRSQTAETSTPATHAEAGATGGRLAGKGRPKQQANYIEECNGPMQGNGARYRFSVLKRDAPEFARRYEAGEFKSVSEACRAAQGVTQGLYKLQLAWNKASSQEREAFLAEINREAE